MADSEVDKSGKAENRGIEVGIAATSLVVQKLFPLPISLAAILKFGSLPSSTNVDQCRPTSGGVLVVKSKSAMVENVETAFGIALHSPTA